MVLRDISNLHKIKYIFAHDRLIYFIRCTLETFICPKYDTE